MTAPVTGCPNCGELKLYMEYDAANRCQVMCHECGVAGPWAQGSDEAGADAWTAFWKRFPSLSPSAPGVEEREAMNAGATALVLCAEDYERTHVDGEYEPSDTCRRHAATLRDLASRLAAPAGDGYTYGHCEERKKPGGCQLHNLHCGYPNCDRKLATPSVAKGENHE